LRDGFAALPPRFDCNAREHARHADERFAAESGAPARFTTNLLLPAALPLR